MKFNIPFKRKSKTSAFKHLPTPPSPIDDRSFLSSAVGSAKADKESGAYDEFLFTEHPMRQMPFEESVDSYLKLLALRLEEQGRWDNVSKSQALLTKESEMAKFESEQVRLAIKIANVEASIHNERQVLDGEITGKHNLYWPESIPEVTSRSGGYLKFLLPFLTFLIVAIVDMGIIYLSINKIPGIDGLEAFIFSAPAVGIQLVLPHFIGERINFLIHGARHKRVNLVELVTFTVMWLSFVVAMTFIRTNFLLAEDRREEFDPNLIFSINLLMLIALGAWLIFLSGRRNPHSHNYVRLCLHRQTLEKKLDKVEKKLLDAKSALPLLNLEKEVAESSFSSAVNVAREQLLDATTSTYRRALINEVGSVDFTSGYFPKNRGLK
jgi:hypothetical protein